MDPRGRVGRIYKEDHYTLLHTKYESSGPCGFGEDFFRGGGGGQGGRMDPRGTVGRTYKRNTIYCYKQNTKALRLVVSEKKIFLCFTHDPPGRGLYEPQGHGWQDL